LSQSWKELGVAAMTYDGPTLRAVRENMGVPLRQIARLARMSHGHLSKVERGEHGRPITPAIVAAYERATGVSLAESAAAVAAQREGVRRRGVWQPGRLSDLRRLAFNAAVGALAVGGQLGDPFTRVIDSAGRPMTPAPVQVADIAQLEATADWLTGLDLRYGGGLVADLGKLLLRWAVPMLDEVSVAEAAGRRLYAAVTTLAGRTAWAAFDVGGHESARYLFRLGMYTAVRSGDVDLRAHMLADAAAQHAHIGYHEDALELVRLVEGDERISAAVRMVLYGVKARAYAGVADAAACRRQIALAEHAHAAAQDADLGDGWLAQVARPGRLYAVTGHAVARLARSSAQPGDLQEACRRLGDAAQALDPVTDARARALCLSRLAVLHLTSGDLEPGVHRAREAIGAASLIRSTRLTRALASIRAAATDHGDAPAVRELVADIDTATETETGAGTGAGAGAWAEAGEEGRP
jgi:transcriptional regulator with XRE-family HTH domain